MSIVYLNGQFMAAAEARISPMDRGFLFGDGVYEVIPSYAGRMVGFGLHIERLQNGLAALEIALEDADSKHWRKVCEELMARNEGADLGLYLQVSRGADTRRFHAYPTDIRPTIFGFAFPIDAIPTDLESIKGYRVTTEHDLRWQRCNIKSTSLLGNVMHFQRGFAAGCNEVLLFNEREQLTEGSSSNAYIVQSGRVMTPPLDHQILPGVTRKILLDILRSDGSIDVKECAVTRDQVFAADEIWLTSSSKEIAPVVAIDGIAVGNGRPGPLWKAAQRLYAARKFDY